MKINKLITTCRKTVMKNKKNKYIVIHYVGGTSTARNNCLYYQRKDSREASAHYFVDDTGIYQCVEDSNAAWHCGAKTYKHKECRNSNSIGIEMCLKKDSKGKLYVTDKTIEHVGELVRELMKKYGIKEDHVIRHYDVTGKSCPNCNGLLNDAKWKAFRSKLCNVKVDKDVEKLQIAINIDLKPKPLLSVDNKLGDKTKAQMKKIKIKKPAVGNFKKYPNIVKFVQGKVGVTKDGKYGKDSKNAVIEYQKKHGLKGTGIVDYNTLMKMIS